MSISDIELKEDICLLIGPEGDFTKEEIDSALNTGFVPVTLGNYRLRTETAGIVGCVMISQAFHG